MPGFHSRCCPFYSGVVVAPRDSHLIPRWAALTLVLLPTLALGSCAGASDEGATGGEAGKRAALAIENFVFQPETLEVASGTRVKVSNKDDTAHTVTAVDKSFDTGNIAGGGEAEFALTRVGEVAYSCSIHPYMRGVIRVRGKE